MTPKGKAKELYDKYEFVYIQNYTSKHEVKQCALIAVDEIMSEANWWHDTSSYQESTDFEGGEKRLNYWQQVKTEIEKL